MLMTKGIYIVVTPVTVIAIIISVLAALSD